MFDLPKIQYLEHPKACVNCVFCRGLSYDKTCRLSDIVCYCTGKSCPSLHSPESMTCDAFVSKEMAVKVAKMHSIEEFKIAVDLGDIQLHDIVIDMLQNGFINDNSASAKQLDFASSIAYKLGICYPLECKFFPYDDCMPFVELDICTNKDLIWKWTNEHAYEFYGNGRFYGDVLK